MTGKPDDLPQKTLSQKAQAAFRAAAADVVRRARQTGTPVIIWEDGGVKELSGAQLDRFNDLLEETPENNPSESP